ncbi:MAG: site-specific integrase [Coleofasciculaceae cyanobacterium]
MSDLRLDDERVAPITPTDHPNPLALSTPLPLTLHPAAVYISNLGPRSKRIMRHALNASAHLLTDGACDLMSLDWSKLRYQHTAALRAVFINKYAPTTANRMLTALRCVLKEARRLKQISFEDYEDATDLKCVKHVTLLQGRALTDSEILALIENCLNDSSLTGIRDAAMISILMAGLRRSEVVALDLSDFDPEIGGLTVRQSKGRQDRLTYLPMGATTAILNWLAIRGDKPGPLLCATNKHGQVVFRRLSDPMVLANLAKRGRLANVAPFSPHDFRRTFISGLLDAGADVITVSRLVGHSDLATTAKYDMRGEAAKQKAVARLKFPGYSQETVDAKDITP